MDLSIMWYMSYLLFAATKPELEGEYVCETCNVLLEAKTAQEAYTAAKLWAKEKDCNNKSMRFVGVEELIYIQDDRPGHGDEIAGSYFDEQNIWSRVSEFIPEKDKLNAVRFEGLDGNKSIGEIIDDQIEKRLKRVLDSE
ncbi:MAG: hypothetical protein AAFY16_10435 [Cyanobacteria bacterium J06642_3]